MSALRGSGASSSTRAVESAGIPASLAITVGVNVRYPDLTDHEEEGPALTGDADAIAAGLAAHAADGTDHVIAALDPGTPESLARFLEGVGRYRATEPDGSH
jgi:hypothetical protein